MECSICYDDISVGTTGCTILSCTHVFHYSCITSWFMNTEQSSCPMCRKEMTGKEDLPSPPPEEEDEEDEEDEDEDEDDEDAPLFSYASLNRLLRSRGGAGLSMAAWLHLNPLGERVCFLLAELNYFLIGNGVSPLTEDEWDALASEEVRLRELQDMSVVHLLADGRWVQEVMNPEEDTGVIACVQKEEVPAAPLIAHLLAKKIQKKWRSTKPITLEQLEAQLFSN